MTPSASRCRDPGNDSLAAALPPLPFLTPQYLLSNRPFYINKICAGSLSPGSCLLRGEAWGRPEQGRRQTSCSTGCQLQPWPHPDIPCREEGSCPLGAEIYPGGTQQEPRLAAALAARASPGILSVSPAPGLTFISFLHPHPPCSSRHCPAASSFPETLDQVLLLPFPCPSGVTLRG